MSRHRCAPAAAFSLRSTRPNSTTGVRCYATVFFLRLTSRSIDLHFVRTDEFRSLSASAFVRPQAERCQRFRVRPIRRTFPGAFQLELMLSPFEEGRRSAPNLCAAARSCLHGFCRKMRGGSQPSSLGLPDSGYSLARRIASSNDRIRSTMSFFFKIVSARAMIAA
jgi:hypothetical protein